MRNSGRRKEQAFVGFFWPAANHGPGLEDQMGKMALGQCFSSVKAQGLSLHFLRPQNPDPPVNQDPLYDYDKEKMLDKAHKL